MTSSAISRALLVRRPGPLPARVIAARSASALDRPLAGDAELELLVPSDELVVQGAFDVQRAGPRRGSGGGPVRVGPGSLWIQLALARPDALVPCDAERLLNRHVRPLLEALTRAGALAHYFGRDWVSSSKRPLAAVGFAHEARTGRACFEAVVAVSTPFAEAGRRSFLGNAPATLAELGRRAPDVARLGDGLVAAFAKASGREVETLALANSLPEAEDPEVVPFLATGEEAIGPIGAGREASGRLRVGGELMASRDAMTALEDALAALEADGRVTDVDAVSAAIDGALGPPAVVFGVRALVALRDVIVRAARA